jgi:transposase
MQDRQLYAQILGIESPWRVERVELQLKMEEVHVFLEHSAEAEWACPQCGQNCPLYDHQAERQWRHLDTCQYRTILHASPPRSNCSEHGALVVKLPWAEPSSRFTMLFERLAIDWLGAASQKAVGDRLHLSWDEIHGIMDRAVKRGLARRKQEPLTYLGVYVAEERKQSSLDGFWPTLSDQQRDGIQAIAMDMWDPYINSTREHLPGADSKIVFDKFHISKHLGDAVDKVRRAENKQLREEDDDRLVGSKYDWLRNPVNFTREAWRNFQDLRQSALKTARAWALKETAMTMFLYRYEGAARNFFRRCYAWASRSRLEPMAEAARMLKKRLDNILTYLKHPITNAASESLNAKVQWVKYTARGFRNQQNFIRRAQNSPCDPYNGK